MSHPGTAPSTLPLEGGKPDGKQSLRTVSRLRAPAASSLPATPADRQARSRGVRSTAWVRGDGPMQRSGGFS